MTNLDDDRPTSSTAVGRPKYLGPPPPLYPQPDPVTLEPEPTNWRTRQLVFVSVASFALGLGIAALTHSHPAPPDPMEAPDRATQALIDEVVNGTPVPPPTSVAANATSSTSASSTSSSSTSIPVVTDVAAFSGTGSGATPPFSVTAGWSLRWQAGPDVSVTLYRVTETASVAVGVPMTGGSGSVSQTETGPFYVDIITTGPWTVNVTQASPSGAGD